MKELKEKEKGSKGDEERGFCKRCSWKDRMRSERCENYGREELGGG